MRSNPRPYKHAYILKTRGSSSSCSWSQPWGRACETHSLWESKGGRRWGSWWRAGRRRWAEYSQSCTTVEGELWIKAAGAWQLKARSHLSCWCWSWSQNDTDQSSVLKRTSSVFCDHQACKNTSACSGSQTNVLFSAATLRWSHHSFQYTAAPLQASRR